MSKIFTFWGFIGKLKYPIVLALILLVNIVLDDNGWMARERRKEQIEQIKADIEKLRKQYEEEDRRYQALSTHKELERVAREKYFMKRANEDVFIIEEEYAANRAHEDSVYTAAPQ